MKKILLLFIVSAVWAADTIQKKDDIIFNDLIAFIQTKSDKVDSKVNFLWFILNSKDSIQKLFTKTDYLEVVKCFKSEISDTISDNFFDVPESDQSYRGTIYLILTFASFVCNKLYKDDLYARYYTKKYNLVNWVRKEYYECINHNKYEAPNNWLSKKISSEAYKFLGSTVSVGGVIIFSSLSLYNIYQKYYNKPKSRVRRENLEAMLSIFNRHFGSSML